MNLKETLELLTAGEFICLQNYPDAYHFLHSEDNEDVVRKSLLPFGLDLKVTDGYESYYCVYKTIDSARDARKLRSQFEKIRDTIAPVVEFITLIMRAENKDLALMPGDSIKFALLLNTITESPGLQTELKRIGKQQRLFASGKSNPDLKDRLQSLLDGMVKEKYLSLSNSEARVYSVTGKMSYFHQCLAFICEHEEIEYDTGAEAESQEGFAF